MFINTVNTKKQQLEEGYFSIGSGREVILIVGSCRSVPYAQYLHEWNDANGDRFTINFIDPYNWCYDISDNRIDMEEKILSLETDSRILDMLKSVDIVIHEYYQNFGMFNFAKDKEKNIYQFGLNPKQDICIPAFNDKFILFGDIVSFDRDIRKDAIADYNVTGKLSSITQNKIEAIRDVNIMKFCDVCKMSDFPEFAEHFLYNKNDVRYFWNSNHVSKQFTLTIWYFMNNKYLHLDLSKGFNKNHDDMYANNFTYLTEYDSFNWFGEQIKPLKEYL